MAQLVLWKNFVKKSNSTKRPTDGAIYKNVHLKEATSIESPSFILEGPVDFEFNYCSYELHYYFIEDIILISNNLYEIRCTQDVLATYKDLIGNYDAFVERSETNYNVEIHDEYLSAQTKIEALQTFTTDLGMFDGTGCFIVRIVGSSSASSFTGVSSYVLNSNLLNLLVAGAFNPAQYAFLAEAEIAKSFFNPFQYIVSVLWIPISYSNVTANLPLSASNIHLGWFDAGFKAYYLDNHIGYGRDVALNMPDRYYLDWRDFDSSFSDYTLFLPGVGMATLPAELISASLRCSANIDYASGNGWYDIYNTGGVVARFEGQFGVPVQIGQNVENLQGAVSSALSTAGSIVSGNLPATAIGAVSTVASLMQPTPYINGTTGNMTIWTERKKPVIYVKRLKAAEYPTTVIGRPLFKNVKINTLTGFIKCGNPSIDLNGFKNDKDAVNSYLANGFYYE